MTTVYEAGQCPAAQENVPHLAHKWDDSAMGNTRDRTGEFWCEGVRDATAPLTLTLRFADVDRLDRFADTAMVAYTALRALRASAQAAYSLDEYELDMAQWDGFTSTLTAMVANAPGRTASPPEWELTENARQLNTIKGTVT